MVIKTTVRAAGEIPDSVVLRPYGLSALLRIKVLRRAGFGSHIFAVEERRKKVRDFPGLSKSRAWQSWD